MVIFQPQILINFISIEACWWLFKILLAASLGRAPGSFPIVHICICLFRSELLEEVWNDEVKIPSSGKPSRWQRSKTGRWPPSPQIHQKYIYMWNNSYRTPTEHWQKTSVFPKGTDAPRRPTRRGGDKSKAEPQELGQQRREREISPSSQRSSGLNLHSQLDVPCICGIPE